ncbi:MAG: hypothetical protein DCC58_10820 [Chloroflexi bacterium]|nr:MAG: hypothetical protein DCC58_10820 [Chloroflexota bacterium]
MNAQRGDNGGGLPMPAGRRALRQRRLQRLCALGALLLLLSTVLPAGAAAAGNGGAPTAGQGEKRVTRGSADPFGAVRTVQVRTGMPAEAGGATQAKPRKFGNSKLDSTLNGLVARLNSRSGEAPEAVAADAPISSGSSVLVTIRTSGEVDSIVAWLAARGGLVVNTNIAVIEAYVPVSALDALTQIDGVGRVQSIGKPKALYGPTNSEGIGIHNADNWHSNGYTGAGVKVGVIDVGFEGYGNLMGSELPSSVNVLCFAGPGNSTGNLADCQNGDVHGTGVAEAVMDIAPGVQLYISNPWTSSDLITAVDWMANNGVQVINHSVGWWWSGPGNGTSPYFDSPLVAVNNAVADGIIWANAAGNEGQSTWAGGYADSDVDGFLEFAPGDETNFIANQTLPAGLTVTILVRWNDTWGGATSDIDVGLYNSSDTLVDSSVIEQSGGQFDTPFEVIQFNVPIADDYYVALYHAGGPAPSFIQVQEFNGYGLEHVSDSFSIGEPADSANPGMLTVGAMNWATPGTIENFSSRGPTTDGRTKPDIVGADRGDSVSYGYSGFSGTSQASPHVAGLAALVRQRYGTNPVDTANYLKQNAVQYGSGTPNNIWGYGLAVLPDVTGGPDNSEAFDAVWQTTDALVAGGGASYSWFWGPTINEERFEPYVESPGGQRQVRYYDKSRMEINDPNGDRNSIYYVTNGLLASELITGRVQRGNATFEEREPATQLVAGDPTNNPGTPSYATLAPYVTTDGVSNRSTNRTGQPVTEFLSGNGALSSTDSGGVTLAHYQNETGHNMASVFWNWANSPNSGLRPEVGVDWVYVLGFPTSEPYWINATVAGVERRVLVQVFERRVLTYTPANPAQFQVEFGNIGLHFLNWIEGATPPPPPPDGPPAEGDIIFSTDLSNWGTSSGDVGSTFYQDGRYHVSVTQTEGQNYIYAYSDADDLGDISASIWIYLEAGDGDGCLLVRAIFTGDYDYAVCVYADPDTGDVYAFGMFEGFDESGYFYEILADLYYLGDRSLLEGGIELKIIAQGNHLWFFADGDEIGDAQHNGPLVGSVGFGVVNYDDPNAQFGFNNLVVRALAD